MQLKMWRKQASSELSGALDSSFFFIILRPADDKSRHQKCLEMLADDMHIND